MDRRTSLLVSLAIGVLSVNAAFAGSIRFLSEVPEPPASLPLLELTPQPAPIKLVNKLLAQIGEAQLSPLRKTPFFQKNGLTVPKDVLGVVEGEHVRVWVNRRTGDVEMYPTLDKLQPLTPADQKQRASRADEIFSSQDFIVDDDTSFIVETPNTLNGATLVRDPNGSVRQEKPTTSYLDYYAARRLAAGLPVDGPAHARWSHSAPRERSKV